MIFVNLYNVDKETVILLVNHLCSRLAKTELKPGFYKIRRDFQAVAFVSKL